jgi:hypothetical protein
MCWLQGRLCSSVQRSRSQSCEIQWITGCRKSNLLYKILGLRVERGAALQVLVKKVRGLLESKPSRYLGKKTYDGSNVRLPVALPYHARTEPG